MVRRIFDRLREEYGYAGTERAVRLFGNRYSVPPGMSDGRLPLKPMSLKSLFL
jgi:hypothetical protein